MIQAGSRRGGRGKDSHKASPTLVCGNMKEAGTGERRPPAVEIWLILVWSHKPLQVSEIST